MTFTNRQDAGRQLAERLSAYTGSNDLLVLGIPRGGISVAFEVAQKLHAPLDVFLSRKLGVPGQEELAFGAISAEEARYLDEQIIKAAGLSESQIEGITRHAHDLLQQKAEAYRGSRPGLPIAGRTVIIVDDGIATGASMLASIHALRRIRPARVVVAVPVAPQSTCSWLKAQVDDLVCLDTPANFYAVSQFYDQFPQVSDEEVIRLLTLAADMHP